MQEFIEVAYTEGTDISSFKVYHYNGSNGGVILSRDQLSAAPAGTCSNRLCFTIKYISGLQNGPDGMWFLDCSSR
jgi:hypothetical protein